MTKWATKATFIPTYTPTASIGGLGFATRAFPFDGANNFRMANFEGEACGGDNYGTRLSGLIGQTPREDPGYASGICIINVPCRPQDLEEEITGNLFTSNPDPYLYSESTNTATGIKTYTLQDIPGFTNLGGSPNAYIQNRFTQYSRVNSDTIVSDEHRIELADDFEHQDTGDRWRSTAIAPNLETVTRAGYQYTGRIFCQMHPIYGYAWQPRYRIVHPDHCSFVHITNITRPWESDPDNYGELIWHVDIDKDVANNDGLGYVPKFPDSTYSGFGWDFIFLDGSYMAGQEFRVNRIYELESGGLRIVPRFPSSMLYGRMYDYVGKYTSFTPHVDGVARDATLGVLVRFGGQ